MLLDINAVFQKVIVCYLSMMYFFDYKRNILAIICKGFTIGDRNERSYFFSFCYDLTLQNTILPRFGGGCFCLGRRVNKDLYSQADLRKSLSVRLERWECGLYNILIRNSNNLCLLFSYFRILTLFWFTIWMSHTQMITNWSLLVQFNYGGIKKNGPKKN